MFPNFNAGRLRHIVEFYAPAAGSDEYGEPLPMVLLFPAARADVEVKSGSQLANIGELLTSEVITCLMWYDPRVNNSAFVKWNNKTYEVQHVKPDAEMRAMLVTAKVES